MAGHRLGALEGGPVPPSNASLGSPPPPPPLKRAPPLSPALLLLSSRGMIFNATLAPLSGDRRACQRTPRTVPRPHPTPARPKGRGVPPPLCGLGGADRREALQ